MSKTNKNQPQESYGWLKNAELNQAFKAYCTEAARLFDKMTKIFSELEHYLIYIEKKEGLNGRIESALTSCQALMQMLEAAKVRKDYSLSQIEYLALLHEFVISAKKNLEAVRVMYQLVLNSKVADPGLYLDTLHSVSTNMARAYAKLSLVQNNTSAAQKGMPKFSHL